MAELTPDAVQKLDTQVNLWFGSVRPDGRPHLAPVWFVYHQGKIFIGTDPTSVKASNIRKNRQVVAALEDGVHPVICEGTARVLDFPLPEDLLAAFYKKYEWDLNQEQEYNLVVELQPEKWLVW